MKISIAWVFDHINADWHTIDITHLVNIFNKKTAEIEAYHHIKTDLTNISFGRITDCNALDITNTNNPSNTNIITVEIPEWGITTSLPTRTNAHVDSWFLVTQNTNTDCTNDQTPNDQGAPAYRWITMRDLGADKDSLIPALYLQNENLYSGAWKKNYESDDIIFHVDNKSVTHRPDMWGHRGFAREVAALLDLPLKPIDTFLQKHTFITAPTYSQTDTFSVNIEDTAGCTRFAALEVSKIDNKPSLVWMGTRLARVDSKPINAIVDFTNYVMLDISQPMHAFDSQKLISKNIVIRKAHNNEKLMLLDDEQIELTDQDIVVCDGTQPIALAGIKGGKATSISNNTHSMLLESANFNATTIRLTAAHHKKRTESSARFEKSLDPMQNTQAIERFLQLCSQANIPYTASGPMLSLGTISQPITIDISHEFIEKKLGTGITQKFIIDTLHALECQVTVQSLENTHNIDLPHNKQNIHDKHTNNAHGTNNTQNMGNRHNIHDTNNTHNSRETSHIHYQVTVPTFRATKDIRLKEDLVEEIGRLFGYENIPGALPFLPSTPQNTNNIMRERMIKNLLAFTGQMQEVYTYSLYDESFLQTLNWQADNTVTIKNPVSQNWTAMVTSLVPHLLKTVWLNYLHQDQLRFFELARVWHQNTTIIEQKSIAGILFNKKTPVNFYEGKAVLQELFEKLRLTTSWQRSQTTLMPWFDPHQTANIMHGDIIIGTAGVANNAFLNRLHEGHAFIFELNGDALFSSKPNPLHYTPTSKYPEVTRDISILISTAYTVQSITQCIQNIDPRIRSVTLIDFFEKKEWVSQKSVTFRCVMQDMDKTMTHDDVENIYSTIIETLLKMGATIR